MCEIAELAERLRRVGCELKEAAEVLVETGGAGNWEFSEEALVAFRALRLQATQVVS